MIKVVGGCMLDSSMSRGPKRRTVDGRKIRCGTNGDHVDKFGRPPTAVSHRQNGTSQAMPNSSMESSAPSREPPCRDPDFSRREGT